MSIDKRENGYVFSIQKFSVHDGPGIRTIVFLKGCPLRCHWCSNPESQNSYQEVAWNASKCIGCYKCKASCPQQAIGLINHGEIKINRSLCESCFKCANVCPATALRVFGQKVTIREVMREVEADSIFYRRSEGGMTLSGGEPLMQSEFAINLLKEARSQGIRTAIETCGHVQWSVLENACYFVQMVIYDIKCIDSDKHKYYTGVGSELILDNLKKICSQFPHLPILVRTPIIPGFNATELDINKIVDLIKPFPNVSYELLPYHRLGEPKYNSLDREYPMGNVKLDEELANHLKSAAKEQLGIRMKK